jgi:septum formation protein
MDSLILASSSPRRRELLEAMGIAFEVAPADVDEALRDDVAPSARVEALAVDKARAAAARARDSAPRFVLGSDTLVCLPSEGGIGAQAEIALGKPEDEEDARSMMRLLAGRSHVVRTGIALLDRTTGALRVVRSDSLVSFAAMSEEEIGSYIASGEWRGVAGAYRIQGRAALFIESLQGSWSGVVGLPLRELYVILKEAGFRIPTGAGSCP